MQSYTITTRPKPQLSLRFRPQFSQKYVIVKNFVLYDHHVLLLSYVCILYVQKIPTTERSARPGDTLIDKIVAVPFP